MLPGSHSHTLIMSTRSGRVFQIFCKFFYMPFVLKKKQKKKKQKKKMGEPVTHLIYMVFSIKQLPSVIQIGTWYPAHELLGTVNVAVQWRHYLQDRLLHDEVLPGQISWFHFRSLLGCCDGPERKSFKLIWESLQFSSTPTQENSTSRNGQVSVSHIVDSSGTENTKICLRAGSEKQRRLDALVWSRTYSTMKKPIHLSAPWLIVFPYFLSWNIVQQFLPYCCKIQPAQIGPSSWLTQGPQAC
jgi:hypothetical protein